MQPQLTWNLLTLNSNNSPASTSGVLEQLQDNLLLSKCHNPGQARWHTPMISVLRRPRQETSISSRAGAGQPRLHNETLSPKNKKSILGEGSWITKDKLEAQKSYASWQDGKTQTQGHPHRLSKPPFGLPLFSFMAGLGANRGSFMGRFQTHSRFHWNVPQILSPGHWLTQCRIVLGKENEWGKKNNPGQVPWKDAPILPSSGSQPLTQMLPRAQGVCHCCSRELHKGVSQTLSRKRDYPRDARWATPRLPQLSPPDYCRLLFALTELILM